MPRERERASRPAKSNAACPEMPRVQGVRDMKHAAGLARASYLGSCTSTPSFASAPPVSALRLYSRTLTAISHQRHLPALVRQALHMIAHPRTACHIAQHHDGCAAPERGARRGAWRAMSGDVEQQREKGERGQQQGDECEECEEHRAERRGLERHKGRCAVHEEERCLRERGRA